MRWLLALLTFALFSWAVVYFRAPTIPVAWDRTLAMFGFAAKDAASLVWNGDVWVFVVALLVGLAVQAWLKPRKGWDWLPALAWPWRVALLVVDVAGDHPVAGQDQCLHLLSVLGERREQPTLAPDLAVGRSNHARRLVRV